MINSSKKPEILAPCGSYDIMIAAIKAGADACYFGGNKFGARAYATNFDTESTIKAIQYAHIHDTRLYLTVNTLFKDSEIKELYDYILPYYEAGLDAVIVQDLGVFNYIKDRFPDLPIHCSTQMNITSVHGASVMKELGAARIVTAREMSLSEIKGIKEKVDIEIESFVHGAMCYSYSGRCLMSSLAGGRSGNRGRCAQPCRKAYDGEYILSMKDMCTLTNLPEIIEAGIDSLKIEGRMKNEYYVASAVSAYKELVEDYFAGDFSVDKANNLQFKLANIFNRGGFCNGYYNMHNGPWMISKNRPNNQGVPVGKVTGVNNGEVGIKLCEDLYKQDVLEIALRDNTILEITSGIECSKGKTVYLKAPKTKHIAVGKEVLRTRCNKILAEVENDIINNKSKISITGKFIAKVGEPMELVVNRTINHVSFQGKAFGDIVQVSQKHSPDENSIREKICQLGQTDYFMDNLEMFIDGDAFVPSGALKTIRREALADMENNIINSFKRTGTKTYNKEDFHENQRTEDVSNSIISEDYYNDKLTVNIGVSNINQLKKSLNMEISGIYLKKSIYDLAEEQGIISELIQKKIKLYIELPEIVKNEFDVVTYLPNINIDGIYINNIDGFFAIVRFIAKYPKHDISKCILSRKCKIISGLYGYNYLARKFMADMLPDITFELPQELNKEEFAKLTKMDGFNNELVVYEHQRVMLSAQCVIKNKFGCNGKNSCIKITDDKGNDFYCKAVCDECCNIIYNGKPLDIKKYLDDNIIKNMNIKSIRYNFTIEEDCVMDEMSYTTGHFRRGVE